MTVAWTQDDAEKLERAIASGRLSVRYKDRTVTYQSTDSMLKALKAIRAELDAASGKRRRRIYRAIQTGRGI